jgi:L-rhamnose-H+ transport protein
MRIGWGILGVLAGGLLNGSFVAPMKRMRGWRWENSWLVYSLVGLLVLPWITAFLAIPHLAAMYSQVSGASLLKVVLLGFGWGIGSVMFGLGVNHLGLAVGYGIILGLIAPIGTFLPLVVLHPERLWTREGYTLMSGMLLVLVGIAFLAVAGKRRERESTSLAPMVKSGFFVGLVICIVAGVFSPMLNFSFVFGQELQTRALAFGAGSSIASSAIWCLTLTSGFVVNAGYCAYLLGKNHTWQVFSSVASPAGYWSGGSLMGLICFGSFLVYGMGATALGPLGGIVGWPLFMSMSLITSSVLGAVTGEWAGASRRAYAYSVAGLALLILAIVVISRGNG